MSFATPIHTSEQSLERVLKAGLPVLLVFWRPGSAPCKELDSTLAQLAIRFEGKALIAKVNVEDNAALVERFKVKAVPSLVFMRDEQEGARATGAAPEERLGAWLAALMSGSKAATPEGPSEALGGGPAQAEVAEAGAAGGVITLTDATFDKALAGTLPLFVDFWAPWCGPCRMVAPSVEQLAREFAGRAIVGKINVDDNQRTAQRYDVMSIPALYIFKGGRPVERVVGAQPLSVLRQALARHV
jgi:thioredoxin 1